MATTIDFVLFVWEPIHRPGETRYRKMFGEYMVYVNDKPLLLLCDNTVFVKKLSCVESYLKNSATGFPYKGAKEHYVLDIEDTELCRNVIAELEKVIPIPTPKRRKTK